MGGCSEDTAKAGCCSVNLKKGLFSRIFYGTLLFWSCFLAHVAGAFFIGLYLFVIILFMVRELGDVTKQEIQKLLLFPEKRDPLNVFKEVNNNVQVDKESLPGKMGDGDMGTTSEPPRKKEPGIEKRAKVEGLLDHIQYQLLYLVSLSLFWFYAGFTSNTEHPILQPRNLTLIGLPSNVTQPHYVIVVVLEFVIRNYGLISAVLYSVFIVQLIRVWSTHFEERGQLACQVMATVSHHMIVFFGMLPLNLGIVVNLDFGVFWGFVTLFSVIINDIAAYFVGRTVGKRKLTVLSPKKTVEGFIGALVITVSFALGVAHVCLTQYPHLLTMPLFFKGAKFTSTNHILPYHRSYQARDGIPSTSLPSSCPYMESLRVHSNPADNKEESTSKCAANVYTTFPQLPLCQTSQIPSHDFVSIQNALRYPSFMGLHINGVYIHSAVLALFASLVAPFGGFFSSALKRSMGRKDFSNALGSHGGFADRFDCKGLMCTFAYGYLSAVLSEHNVYSSGAGPSIMRLS